jgi:carboxypeptidase Q
MLLFIVRKIIKRFRYFMKKIGTALFFLLLSHCSYSQSDSLMLVRIANECLIHSESYVHLEELCKEIGGRLSGSPQAAQSVDMVVKWANRLPGVRVEKQPCMVPHWVRGAKEEAIIFRKGTTPIILYPCALGNSVATPAKGIKAKVVEILRWTQLDSLGKAGRLKNRIAFYNRPMNPTLIDPGAGYGDAVDQRWGGASRAAAYGAIGVVVRSVTHAYDQYPHTGAMGYSDTLNRIPALSLSTIDATLLGACVRGDSTLEMFLKDDCKMLADEPSFNVIAEIKGSVYPDEIITVGGHLDSWDLAEGAHDDGTGVVQAIEVIRILKALHLQPKRTIRAVAFMNEENGGRGGKAYLAAAKAKNEKHYAAIESDGGGFAPMGFSMSASPEIRAKIKKEWKPLLETYGVWNFDGTGGGADIGPLKEIKTTLFGLEVDSHKYFDYHHTGNDVFENVNKRELDLGAASMAMLVWLLSEKGL